MVGIRVTMVAMQGVVSYVRHGLQHNPIYIYIPVLIYVIGAHAVRRRPELSLFGSLFLKGGTTLIRNIRSVCTLKSNRNGPYVSVQSGISLNRGPAPKG